ncbi:MAG: septum site-determining protein MinC [Gammaproteobacteria bacterium]
MINAASKQTQNVFKLSGSLVTITTLHLLKNSLTAFKQQLQDTISKSPQFFQHAPIILDLSGLADPIKLNNFITPLRQAGIIPVGIRSQDEDLIKQASELNIAVFPANTKTDTKPTPENKTEKPHRKSKLITSPVRSGQQIYAPEADLIIIGPVSHGAEILADGHIHVYGPVRGRVLAGVMGDSSARIFCKSLDAELISIAGRYKVSENIPSTEQDAYIQILLDDDQLKIEHI